MVLKPFRPLTLKRSAFVDVPGDTQDCHAVKKARISTGSATNIHPRFKLTKAESPSRNPESSGLNIQFETKLSSASRDDKLLRTASGHASVCYAVLWRNFKTKKHKTWEGDGILSINSGQAHLKDLTGRHLGKSTCDTLPEVDTLLSVGGKEVMIESVVSDNLHVCHDLPSASTANPSTTSRIACQTVLPRSETVEKENSFPESTFEPPLYSSKQYRTSSFKTPLKEPIPSLNRTEGTPLPRHDPNAPGALVMKRPSEKPSGKHIVDVVVDPLLSKNLREHQRTGVQFLYECVMGMRPFNGEGAILADEMGLGKTLQVITLLWTLLKQTPVYGERPIVKRALIVCPVTLIRNWKKEFRKWLGLERIGVFILEDKRSKLTDFTEGKSYSVMIIGYEKLRTVYNDLQKGTGIDIVIADEGHRLKSAQNKCGQAIKSFATGRKVILSGTPLQNDLSEFYFMVDFVNPGILSTANKFKRDYEVPILNSRQPEASEQDIEKGQERSEELAKLTSLFILRRTAEILAKYLPEKTEYVLFCRPTWAQALVYRRLLESPAFPKALATQEASLQLIGILKKLCNCPSLLYHKDETGETCHNPLFSHFLESVNHHQLRSPGASGKLQVLDSLLFHLHKTTDEKVVIVSNYTATLNIIENLLSSLEYTFLRLDGTTSQSKRQDAVDKFNRAGRTYFAFLLSAKSGGMGLNLIGASRIVLFDNDWNPSTDLQAMARIHRDGQTRPCKIYRLLTKGAMDEKIYQRQLTKMSLADSVVDKKISTSCFTKEELKDLFRLDEKEECQTHTLLGCKCNGTGMIQSENEDDVTATQSIGVKDKMRVALMRFRHYSTAKLSESFEADTRFEPGGGAKVQTGTSQPNSIDSPQQDLDGVLLNALKDSDCRIDFIFAQRRC